MSIEKTFGILYIKVMEIRMINKKGVTLVALTTMVLLIVILTGTITYISINAIDLKRANETKADLRLLTDKVEEYFLRTDSLPISGEGMLISTGAPTATHRIGEEELPSAKRSQFDSGKYFLINYELLDGLTLNNDDRAYILNEGSHTVYVLDGYNTSQGKEYALPYINKINQIED